MKNYSLGLFSALFLLMGATVHAQNQGDTTPLGSGGTKMLCNVNSGLTATASGNGKLNFPACTAAGQMLITGPITGITPGNGASELGKSEDAAHASGDIGVETVFLREDALTVSTSASGDYQVPKTDAMGRQIITMAPAGEFWSSCGTATAVTTDVAIKAAVASNRIYVTSITCKNTSASVASSLDFKDATTVIAVGGISQMAAGAAGSFTATFPVPLRGTSNTAFNFATNVAVTSVTCCGSGYISVN